LIIAACGWDWGAAYAAINGQPGAKKAPERQSVATHNDKKGSL
jgi:hypothetical protein